MKTNKTLKICEKEHEFYKSSDCSTCPVCEEERKPQEGFLSLLAAPARRALEENGIITLEELSTYSRNEVFNLHGVGKSTVSQLEKLLSDKQLTFNKKELISDRQKNLKIK